MCGNNCIEVRLIEQEDVKQRQYWEFINGPHLLRLINYSWPTISTIKKSKYTRIVFLELGFQECASLATMLIP